MFDLAKSRLRRNDGTGWMRTLGLMVTIWSALMAGSLAWDMHQQQQSLLNTATAAASVNIRKDMSFRKWAASHGGVYVPPTEHTPPNPYLKVPDRDVVTTTGKTLTLMNPAYVLRQIQSDFPDDYGTKSHITSLKPLNPNNAADAWEAKALHAFEQGGKELLETQQIDGQLYLRMMLPLIVEPGCLKCHAQQGYKLGDIRGGISSSVPLAPFLAREQEFSTSLVISHGAIWLLGLLGLAWLGVSFRRIQHLEISARSAAVVEESERRFRAVTESANDAIISADSAGKVVGWNPCAERLFGYSWAEINGQPLTGLMPERFRNLHREGLARVVSGGAPHVIGKTVELAGLRKDGSEFPLELSLAQWQAANGQFFTAIIRDITERKRAEELLSAQFVETQRARLEWQAVFDSISQPIFLHDGEFRVTRANMAYAQAAGMDVRDVIGQPYWKMFPRGDGPMASCTHTQFSHKEESEEFGTDGKIYHSRAFLAEYIPGEQYAVHIIEDITERKHAETAFTTLVGTAAANIGAAFFRETVRSLSAWLGVECVIIGELVDGNRVRALAMQLDGQAVEHYEYALPGTPCESATEKGYCEYHEGVCQLFPSDKDLSDMGAEAYVGMPIRDKNGKAIGVLCAISRYKIVPQTITKGVFEVIAARAGTEIERQKTEDKLQEMLKAAIQSRLAMLSMIEDQKRTDEEVRQLNAELEEKVLARTADLERARHDAEDANQAKSKFLATMSHEIRTPMNGVIGMVDVLQQSSLNGPQMEMANIIHDSAFALLAIIDDILDFSKIEAGKLQIDSVPMSVVEVVEGACGAMDHMAAKKGVELMLFTDPAIPAAVMGDPGRLRQILVNLTNNAIKFSSGQQRQGKVSVRTLPTESTPEQVTLEFRVTDNGIGMDEATQARLFTPFAQADSSTTRIYGGTGLGLAISRQLVSIMGGEITVQSEPGKGSMFSVRLPFKLLPDVGRAASTGSGQDSSRPLRQAQGRHDELVGLKPDLPNHDLVAGLHCLVVGGTGGLADDLAAYLVHAGALVERVTDLTTVKEWIASRPPGLCIVLIDTPADNPPLDKLRAAALAHPERKTSFVVIRRGQRREPRLEDADLVLVDGNILTRRALLKAVAVAAGWVKQSDRETPHGDVKATAKPLSREEARRQGRLILIAEDNEINQKVILQQLALLGQTADIASNGREALEMWQSGGYGLLLTDLHMPEMDGYELTATIRAAETAAGETSQPRMPIIAITANVLKGEAEHCLAIGMDDYLSKPVQLVNLKAMLEKWLPDTANPLPQFHGESVGRVSPQGVTRQEVAAVGVGLRSANPTYGAPAPAAVDVNVLKKLVGDDEEIIRDFLHDFRLSAEKIAAELRTACAAGQAADAGALAHKLKSSARSVGALALGELCAAMEQAGKAGDSKALAALLPRFEQELAGVVRFLEGY